MGEIAYRFTDAVEGAIAEERARLLRLRKLGLITSPQATEMLTSFLARHMYAARVEDNPDRPVGVKCHGCGLVHVIPVSVKYFQCRCSPHVDRMTATNRVPLI